MDTEIFETEKIDEPKKKRKLTQKQLEALQKGRAKMEEKRKQKINKEAEKQMVKDDKKQLIEMRTKLKEQEKIKTIVKTNNQNDDYIQFKNKFNDLKNDLLDKIEDKEQFKAVKKHLNNYNLNNFKTIEEVKNKMKDDLLNNFIV